MRETHATAESFDYKCFPWVPQLQFIPNLAKLNLPDDALKLHEFFKAGGANSPIVPMKERSWQIFGDEKRLESISATQLFGPARLTEQMLRCRLVSLGLLYHVAPHGFSTSALIVENESSFHSLTRLNAQKSLYSATIYGAGNTVLKATRFLSEMAESLGQKQFFYFGDLDRRGFEIPVELDGLMQTAGIRIVPEENLYREALRFSGNTVGTPAELPDLLLAWLPESLRSDLDHHLRGQRRIAQEALGWERLSEIYGVNPTSEFSLGFVPLPK